MSTTPFPVGDVISASWLRALATTPESILAQALHRKLAGLRFVARQPVDLFTCQRLQFLSSCTWRKATHWRDQEKHFALSSPVNCHQRRISGLCLSIPCYRWSRWYPSTQNCNLSPMRNGLAFWHSSFCSSCSYRIWKVRERQVSSPGVANQGRLGLANFALLVSIGQPNTQRIRLR